MLILVMMYGWCDIKEEVMKMKEVLPVSKYLCYKWSYQTFGVKFYDVGEEYRRAITQVFL